MRAIEKGRTDRGYIVKDEEFRSLCRFAAMAMRFPAPSEGAFGYKYTKHERELFKQFASFLPDVLLFYITMLASGDVSFDSLEVHGIDVQKIVRERLGAVPSASPSSEGDSAAMPNILKALLDEGKQDQRKGKGRIEPEDRRRGNEKDREKGELR